MNLSEVVAGLKDKRLTPAEAKAAIAALGSAEPSVSPRVSVIEQAIDSGAPAAQAILPSRLKGELQDSLADVLYMDRGTVDPDTSFSELGLDSILGVEWVRSIEKRYKLAIATTILYAHPSINSLVEYLLVEQLQHEATQPVERLRMVPEKATPEVPPATVERIAPAVDVDSRTRIERELRASLAEALYSDEKDLNLDTPFSELGLDSIIGIEWVRAINRLYAHSITATKLYEYPTLRSLAEYFTEHGVPDFAPSVSESHIPPDAPVAVQPAAPPSAVEEISIDVEGKSNATSKEVIAIIGAAGTFPGAKNLDIFWENLASGKESISEVPPERWSMGEYFSPDAGDAGRSYSKWLGVVEDADKFDPQFFNISPAEAERIDPQQRLFLETCWHCLEDAGVKPSSLSGSRCGVFVGCAPNDYGISSDAGALTPEALMGGSLSILSARIAYFLNLKGPCLAIETSCSSSLVALSQACDSLMSGQSDVAFAGGVCVLPGPRMHIMTSKAGMLSKSGRCFSFDDRADGFVPGEGVGVVLLKRLSDAIRDGDSISAIVRGTGINQDGRTNGITAPNAKAQATLVRDIYEHAEITPDSISLVEAHGTATRLGDPIEVEALTSSFQHFTQRQGYCALGTVKSNIGHLLAAAGIAGVLKVMLAIRNRNLPPTINFEHLNRHIVLEGTPFYINTGLQPWESVSGKPRRAAVSSFGFSGTNAHVVLEEYIPTLSPVGLDPHVTAVILLSARNQAQLTSLVTELLQKIDDRHIGEQDFIRLAYTLQAGRDEMECRLAIIAESVKDVASKLHQYLSGNASDPTIFTGSVEREHEVLSLLTDDQDILKAVESWLDHRKYAKLSSLWVKGMRVDWGRIYAGLKLQRIRLPLYPFARERYWSLTQDLSPQPRHRESTPKTEHSLEMRDGASRVFPTEAPRTADAPMMFQEYLEHRELDSSASRRVKRIICVVGSEELRKTVEETIRQYAPTTEVAFIREGTRSGRNDRGDYSVERNQAHSLTQGFRAIREECGGAYDAILYLSASEDIRCSSDYSVLLHLFQAVSLSHIDCASVYVAVHWSDALSRCYAESWIGFERSLRIGMPDLAVKIVCLEKQHLSVHHEHSRGGIGKSSVKIVLDEISNGQERSVLYKDGKRYCYRVRKLQWAPSETLLRRGATYLVVGGAGGLGGLVAAHLATQYQARVVLTGRSAENPAIREQVDRLKRHGGDAIYLQANVCDAKQMRQAVIEARRRFGGISGVVHVAGSPDKRSLVEKSVGDLEAVLAPKVEGIRILDEVLKDEQSLEFMAYFSSSSATLGDPGWCDYAAANRFMTAYAENMPGPRNSKRVAVNWPLWKEGGIQFDTDESRDLYLQGSGQRALGTEEGLIVFEQLLGSKESVVLVMAGDKARIEKALDKFDLDSSRAVILGKQTSKARTARPTYLKGLTIAECVAWDLKEQASKFLKITRDRLDTKKNLLEFGFDSISLGRFAILLSQHYSVDLTPAVFFSHATLEALTHHLLADHLGAMTTLYGEGGVVEDRAAEVRVVGDIHRESDLKAASLPTDEKHWQKSRSAQEPIAIIGASGRFPQARNIHELWEILEQGRDVIDEIPGDRFDWRLHYGDVRETREKINCKWMGSIPGVGEFDALFFEMSPLEAQFLDPRQRLLLQEAWNALEDAAYGPLQLARERIGVYVGAERGDYEALAGEDAAITSNHDGILATRLSYFLNLRGPAMTINTACSSGLVAAHQACLSLRAGECDVAIAAGVNILSTPAGFLAMGRAGMLSPDGRCHAFSQSANGMVPAEAIVALVLKPLAKAEADGDPVYAVIRGSGINYDGKTNGITAPSGSSQTALLCETYDRLGLNAREIDYVVTHGTGTKIGDPIEINALCDAFKKYTEDRGFCALTSTKSNLGHSFAASGLVSVVSLVQAMRHGTIPASLHCESESEDIHWAESPFFVNKSNRAWVDAHKDRRIGVVSSFGMSGTNAHMIVESYAQRPPEAAGKMPPMFLLVLSAKTDVALAQRGRDFLKELGSEKRSAAWLYDASSTLLCGRHHFEHRCAFVVNDSENAAFMCSQIGSREAWPNLFRGRVGQDFRPGTALSRYAEDLLVAAGSLHDDGDKYQESLYALADLFCQGYNPSWSLLFAQAAPRRISIPGYPFARERLWATSPQLNIEKRGQEESHRIAGEKNNPGQLEVLSTKRFTGEEVFLTDHVIQGLPVLPAVAYLEVVREAFERVNPSRVDPIEYLSFENVVFSKALIVTVPCTVNMSFAPGEPGAYGYSLYTAPPADDGRSVDDRRVVHSQGIITKRPFAEAAYDDNLAVGKLVSGESVSPELCYQRFEEMGLSYGPAHRGIVELTAGIDADGRRVALARVAIPRDLTGTGKYILHPCLLDAALQASIGLTLFRAKSGSDLETLLPFAIDRVDVFHQCANNARVVLVETGVNENMLTFDADVFDDENRICVRFRDFHARRVSATITRTNSIRVEDQQAGHRGALTPEPSRELAALPVATSESVSVNAAVVRFVMSLLADTLKIPKDRMEPSAPFEKYGIDSLSVIRLTSELEKSFGTLPKTLFFEYENIGELSKYFCENYASQLEQLPGMAKSTASDSSARGGVDVPAPPPVELIGQSLVIHVPTVTRSSESRAVAVAGIAGRYPKANNLSEFWKNLCSGMDCISEIPAERWDHSVYFDADKNKAGKSYSKWGGFIDDVDRFDPLFFNISPREAELMDPQERLFLQCAYETLEDAGYTREALSRYNGRGLAGNVGVFVGVMYEEYQLFGAQAQVSGEPLALFGSPASIANRVSYFCNFHGPSLAVDTMCSSSLTAIHLAIESLLSGACEAAIAGGVNVSIHPNKYLTLSQGKFASSIGRCESFGIGGDGYVPGEGVGAVLLKPLERAIADRDQIYGVIQSSALNHGGKTSGYSVPNPNAQANAITQAQHHLQTPVRAISYVETHGTGTSLGDPIEIAGLSKAFSGTTEGKHFCAIGSVKSNIGHCESAAGIAGLTKVLLQMQHSTLVPSLHSETLNPYIDFENSPFVVQRELSPWKRPILTADGESREYPRIAGLSSFGAGGSNAHLIISEYEANGSREQATETPRTLPVIVSLSARTKKQLLQRFQQLDDAIRAGQLRDDHLQDVAYTLQVGREAMEYRAAFTAASMAELSEKLGRFLSNPESCESIFAGEVGKGNSASNFLASDEDAQQTVNAWIEKRKYDRLMELWVGGGSIEWEKLYCGALPQRISLPTYPFARDRFWAPVQKPGSFVADATGPGRLHPLVHRNTSGFSGQRYTSEFTGEEAVFADHLVGGSRLLPAAAYMEMALASIQLASDMPVGGDLEKRHVELRDVEFLRPLVAKEEALSVHISLEAGDDNEIQFTIYSEAGHSEYTMHCKGRAFVKEQVREPERLNSDIRAAQWAQTLKSDECYERFQASGLEYGPTHRVLSSVSMAPASNDELLALASYRLPDSMIAGLSSYLLHPSILDAALQATIGAFPNGQSQRIFVPVGIEAVEIFGIPQPAGLVRISKSDADMAVPGGSLEVNLDVCREDGDISLRLTRVSLQALQGGSTIKRASTILVKREWDRAPLPQERSLRPPHRDHWVWICSSADHAAAPWAEAVSIFRKEHPAIQTTLLAAPVGQNIAEMATSQAVQVFEIIQRAFQAKLLRDTLVQVVLPAGGDELLFSCLGPLLKSAQLENPRFIPRTLIFEDKQSADELVRELLLDKEQSSEPEVRYLRKQRWAMRWRELAGPASGKNSVGNPWKDAGSYLITGGAGGLGLLFAEEICRRTCDAKIMLTGRSPLAENKRQAIDHLRGLGGRIEYRQLDVADAAAVSRTIEELHSEFGGLQGIIHSAGVIHDNFVIKKTREEFMEVMAPKCAGVVNLDEATKEIPLHFFAIFSSLAGVLGNVGQSDYASANAFLDQFARHRSALVDAGHRSGRSIAINWPFWQDGGMRVDPKVIEHMRLLTGLVPLPTVQGIDAFYRAFQSQEQQVMVVHQESGGGLHQIGLQAAEAAAEVDMGPAMAQADLELVAVAYVKKALAKILKLAVDQIETSASFERYGIDSVLMMQMTSVLEQEFGSLPKTLLFEYQGIASLAGYLVKNHSEQLARQVRSQRGEVYLPSPKSVSLAFSKPSSRSEFKRSQAGSQAKQPVEKGRWEEIAIIGMSGKYPEADDLYEFWENLKNGKDCVTEVPADRWDYTQYFDPEKGKPGKSYSKWGGFLRDVDVFDPLFFNISPREAKMIDPQERLLLQCAYEALEDAGYTRESVAGGTALGADRNVGVFVGVMYEEYQLFGAQSHASEEPFALAGSPSSIANRVSYFCNFHGPSLAVDTMCSSSLTAIHLACQSLHEGECTVAMAGGVNLSIHPNKYIGLSQALFVSSRGRCESFGEGGEGYVPAEGVGVVLLKPLRKAVADRDHIYGVLKATAVNHGGKNNGYSVPNPVAQGKVIAQALKKSGLPARAMSYIEAHGTGTRLGDPIEIAGLSKAFSASTGDKQFCAIGSVKSNIGHSESAAGVAGLTKILLQMKHGLLVPSLHAETLNPIIDFGESPFMVQRELGKWKRPAVNVGSVTNEYPRIAGLSSFGAGGSNAHFIVEEYVDPPEADVAGTTGTPLPVVLVLSARSAAQRTEQAVRLLEAVGRDGFNDGDLVRVAYTLQVGREAMEYRMAFTAASIDELDSKLREFVDGNAESSGVILGDTRQSKQYISMFDGDDEFAQAIGLWLHRGKYRKVMDAWTKGIEVDWRALYGEVTPRRISLPTYPFAKEHYWIDKASWMQAPAANAKKQTIASSEELNRQAVQSSTQSDDSLRDRALRFITKQWEPADVASAPLDAKRILIVSAEETKDLAEQLASSFPGSSILHLSSQDVLPPTVWDHFNCWVDVTGCSSKRPGSMQWITPLQQWMVSHGQRDLVAVCVTRQLESFKNEAINISGALPAGLYRMLQSEYSYVRSRHIDTDCAIDDRHLVEQVISELTSAGEEPEVCYRAGQRYRSILEEGRDKPSFNGMGRSFPEGKVLWITGGSRGLGYLCAQHFVRHYGVKQVVLTGRETLPPPEEWATYEGDRNSIGKKILAIRDLQSQGAEVRYSSVALGDFEALRNEFAEVERAWGPVGGVIHCAGNTDSESPAFLHKALPDIQSVLSPKVEGLDNLFRCVSDSRPDFVVLFSSVSAAIPALGVGQADYAMANAYLDYKAIAHAHELPILSLQWPSWSESGIGEVGGKTYRNSGLMAHSDDEGLKLLDWALSLGISLVGIPAVVDPAIWKPERLMHRALHGDQPTRPASAGQFLKTEDSERDAVHEWLTSLVCECLSMQPGQIDIDTPLYDYGVDSVMFAQLSRRVAKIVGESLDPSVFFEHPDLRSFTNWLLMTYSEVVTQVATATVTGMMSVVPVLVQEPTQPSPLAPSAEVIAAAATALNIAVVGVTCRFPGADNLEAYWQLLAEGRSAITAVPAERWGTGKDYYAGLIDRPYYFDPGFFLIPAGTAAVMDPQALLALEESLKLFCHAGYSVDAVKGSSTGVYLGARSYDRGAAEMFAGLRDPVMAAGQNYLAANVSRFFDFHGPSLVIDSACSSALVAMQLAIQALQGRDITAAVVGGVSMLHDEGALQIFKQRGILSPAAEFHLFDGRAQGAVLGEGAGFVLLKTVEQAQADGDTIYAVIKSIAVNNDGRTAGSGAPNTQAQRDVMHSALRKSGLGADEIGYIDVNGSGSEITDLLELRAIETVYRQGSRTSCMLGSMKPNIGHPLTAEGIASFIRVVLMLHHKQFVPFLSAEIPMKHYDLASSPFRFPRKLSPWDGTIRVAAINCFADGGTNAHVILSSIERSQSSPSLRVPIEVPALSRFDVRGVSITALPAGSDRKNGSGTSKSVAPVTKTKNKSSFWHRLPTVESELLATTNSSH